MGKVYALGNVCMQYVCIAHPDPKASEQEEQKKVTDRMVSSSLVKTNYICLSNYLE